MKRITFSLWGAAALGVFMGATTTGVEAEERQLGYSLTLSATSDYIFRGLSYNTEDPAFQPYLELNYGIAYAALVGSNIADPYGPFEVDLYVGIRPVTGPISWDIAALYYTYPGGDDASDYDYVEFKIGASISPVTNLTLGLTGFATPDQGVAYVETQTLEGSLAYTLPQFANFTPTLGGVLGYTRSPEPTAFFFGEEDYLYWNAGLKLAVEKFYFDFRYWDTDIGTNAFNGGNIGLVDSRFVFSAGVTLP